MSRRKKKKDKSKRKRTHPTSGAAWPKGLRKTSEMITELAGDFVISGRDLEDMQGRLYTVCLGWNLALMPPAERDNELENYLEDQQMRSPSMSEAAIAQMRGKLQEFIDKKLEMFPHDERPIVQAHVTPQGERGIQISVISAVRPKDIP